MELLVNYFGYGANIDLEMMEAIIGRKPNGQPAILQGFELCVQTWDEIPQTVRNKLTADWGSDFRAYRLRPAEGKSIRGMVWSITPDESELVKNWEFDGLWSQSVEVGVTTEDGTNVRAETAVTADPNIKIVVDAENYPPFLNDRERMLAGAIKSRQDYLRETQKPRLIER